MEHRLCPDCLTFIDQPYYRKFTDAQICRDEERARLEEEEHFQEPDDDGDGDDGKGVDKPEDDLEAWTDDRLDNGLDTPPDDMFDDTPGDGLDDNANGNLDDTLDEVSKPRFYWEGGPEILDNRNLVICYQRAETCQLCAIIKSIHQTWTSEKDGDLLHLPLDRVALSETSHTMFSHCSKAQMWSPKLDFTGQHKNPTTQDFVGFSVYFYPIMYKFSTVDYFCENTALDEPLEGTTEEVSEWDHLGYTARIRPQQINFDLLLKWQALCKKYHSTTCGHGKHIIRNRPRLRAIDVHRACVTDIRAQDHYVALSYVWGGKNHVQMTKNNRAQLEQPFSTLFRNLPQTISDAIQVTKNLGLDYIWVDALCIIQDSDEDKALLISAMNKVYAGADLTIIAAAGSHADSGLPGVRADTRSPPQEIIQGSKYACLQSLQNINGNDKPGYLGDCVWNTRGWTFQERLSSRRALIFGTQQVYWECHSDSWREDLFAECENPVYRLEGALPGIDISDIFGINRTSNFELSFRTLAEEYSARSLSFRSDYLNAFTGILQQLHEIYREECFWAMPQRIFADCLTWQNHGVKISLSLHRLRIGPSDFVDCPFPSWSWLGWEGKVLWTEVGGELEETTGMIYFYKIDRDDQPKTIEAYGVFEDQGTDGEVSFANGRQQEVAKEDIPAWLKGDPLRFCVICFWTECLEDIVFEEGTFRPKIRNQHPISPDDQSCSGSDDEETERVDAVLISAKKKYWQAPLKQFIALQITYKNGIAYRKRSCRLSEKSWEQCHGRVWKLVILG